MSKKLYFNNKDNYTKLLHLKNELNCLGKNPSMNDIHKLIITINDNDIKTHLYTILRKISYLGEPGNYNIIESSLHNLAYFWEKVDTLLEIQLELINSLENIIKKLFRATNNSDQEADRTYIISELNGILKLITINHNKKQGYLLNSINTSSDVMEYCILNRVMEDPLPQVPMNAVTFKRTNLGINCLILHNLPSNFSDDYFSTRNEVEDFDNDIQEYIASINVYKLTIESIISKINHYIDENNRNLIIRNTLVQDLIKSLIQSVEEKLNFHAKKGQVEYLNAGLPNIPNWLNKQS